MLTIGQLADYVGVTPRAVRHYHRIGLLPEPERSAAGYRTYTAQDVVDLQRIKVLADAGVPLARVRELLVAESEELQAAISEIDAGLRRRIREMQATRRSLAELGAGGPPFLPPEVVALDDRMRELGISEATRTLNRDAWVLIQVLFPDLMPQWHSVQLAMLDDPAYRDVYSLTDQALGWAADDPRIEDVARRTVEWAMNQAPSTGVAGWDADATAYNLVTNYQRDASPGWRRLMERVHELAVEAQTAGERDPDEA